MTIKWMCVTTPVARHTLSVAVSDDEITWTRVCDPDAEENAEFCYPAVMQSADGMVHITYTWKRRSINHVVLDPQQFELKALLAEQTR